MLVRAGVSCMLDDELFSFQDVPLLFGRYLVLQSVLTDDDVKAALRVQSDLYGNIVFIALEQQIMSVQQFIECRAYQRRHCVSFEEAAQVLNYLSNDVLQGLREQLHHHWLPLGQILVRQGKLTAERLADLLEDFKINGSI